MEDSREEQWRDVYEYGEDKSKIHELMWDVYTGDKEDFIKICFGVSSEFKRGEHCLDLYEG